MMAVTYQLIKDLEAVRGDTFNYLITLQGTNFTGCTYRSEVRNSRGKLILDLSPTGDIVSDDLVVTFLVDSETMAEAPLGVFFWDFELTFPGGIRRTYVKGTFTILVDYTL